jgi:hypothetical protein
MTRLARALVPAALLATACGGLDEVDFTRSTTITVPGGPGGALPVDAIGAVDLDIDRTALEAEGIDPDDVDSARLVGVRLEVTQGTSLEQWLDDVELHAEAPGLPRTLLARRTGIRALPASTSAVDLETSGADLKPFVLADTATVIAGASGLQPPVDTTVRVIATIRVDVNVSGLFH